MHRIVDDHSQIRSAIDREGRPNTGVAQSFEPFAVGRQPSGPSLIFDLKPMTGL